MPKSHQKPLEASKSSWWGCSWCFKVCSPVWNMSMATGRSLAVHRVSFCPSVACYRGTFSLPPIVLLQSLSGRYPDESVSLKFGTRHALRRRCGFQRKLRLMPVPLPRVVADWNSAALSRVPPYSWRVGRGYGCRGLWHLTFFLQLRKQLQNPNIGSCCWWKTGQISQRILDSVSLTTTVVCDTVDTGLGVRVCGKTWWAQIRN